MSPICPGRMRLSCWPGHCLPLLVASTSCASRGMTRSGGRNEQEPGASGPLVSRRPVMSTKRKASRTTAPGGAVRTSVHARGRPGCSPCAPGGAGGCQSGVPGCGVPGDPDSQRRWCLRSRSDGSNRPSWGSGQHPRDSAGWQTAHTRLPGRRSPWPVPREGCLLCPWCLRVPSEVQGGSRVTGQDVPRFVRRHLSKAVAHVHEGPRAHGQRRPLCGAGPFSWPLHHLRQV